MAGRLRVAAPAAEAFAGGRAALAAGDSTQAALRLGVALRLEPGFAETCSTRSVAHGLEPALALVAGDALRLLGRESEALAAFDMARGASSAASTPAALTGDVPGVAGAPARPTTATARATPTTTCGRRPGL